MRYGSMFSGIEAASVAWKPLGWECAWVCEMDKFPSAVLAHHYPKVPNLGDVTKVDWDAIEPVDLIVGGAPCQDFSVAGLRRGLDGDRGNLSIEFFRIVGRVQPRWVVFENVPGLLSMDEGRAFAYLLGLLAECGYGFAYRVLDAQHSGVPQRRRRVFVVGYLGDWRPPAAVLFEQESLLGHPAPRREAGQSVAGTIKACAGKSGTPNGAEEADRLIVAPALTSNPYGDHEGREGLLITHSLRADGFDASEDGTGRGTPLVAFALNSHAGAADGDQTNRSHAAGGPVGMGVSEEMAYSLRGGRTQNVASSAVRRLTPTECERLQGFPDNYTQVPYRGKPATDGPRYKSLGNSMAIPDMRWIGRRIQAVQEIIA